MTPSACRNSSSISTQRKPANREAPCVQTMNTKIGGLIFDDNGDDDTPWRTLNFAHTGTCINIATQIVRIASGQETVNR